MNEIYVSTNMGFLPLATYRNLVAQQEGYKDYEDMKAHGKVLNPKSTYRLTANRPVRVNV